jgi:hypothetical protein
MSPKEYRGILATFTKLHPECENFKTLTDTRLTRTTKFRKKLITFNEIRLITLDN